jgi:hypothetical protein
LSAAVAAAWSDRAGPDRERAGPALTAALTGRLAPVTEDWLGLDPGQVDAVPYDGDGWGELAITGTGPQRRLTAALPPDWLARVWAPGLAVIDGHLVVAAPDADWPRAEVLALPRPGADPVTFRVATTGGHWTAIAGPPG